MNGSATAGLPPEFAAADSNTVPPVPEARPGEIELLRAEIQALPERVADAIYEAVTNQHRLIIDDIRSVLHEFTADLHSSSTEP